MDRRYKKGYDHRKPSKKSTKKNSEHLKVSKKSKYSKKESEKIQRRPSRVPSKLLSTILWIITFVTFVIGASGVIRIMVSYYFRPGGPDWDYALVVSPLANNTEMVVFKFDGLKRNLNLRTEDNVTFNQVFDRHGVTEEFRKAFEEAEELIPWLERSSSPLIFVAGDDMKLLKKENSTTYERYLDDLKELFKTSRLMWNGTYFHVLEDWEEAVNGWIALNYMTDYITKGRQAIKAKRDTFTTTFTLGGLEIDDSSIHITYEVPKPLDNIPLPPKVKERIRVVTLFGRVYYLYTQSLLCYGTIRLGEMYEAILMEKAVEDVILGVTYRRRYCLFDRFITEYPIATDRFYRHCSRTETLKYSTKQEGRFLLDPYPAECIKEVKYIYDCKSHFIKNECPPFEFPERPYNITFAIFNDFASYALLAGIKDGDSKEEWRRKRDKCCSKRGYYIYRDEKIRFYSQYQYEHMCYMMTFLYIFLDEKLKLSKEEYANLKIIEDVDDNRFTWRLGHLATITKALPIEKPTHETNTLEDMLWEGIAFSIILTISTFLAAFAIRSSSTLGVRPLQLPQ